ncbi:transcriptional repressor [Desulfovibrio sp. OttesenSCG-928-A18]|nr:transcriptional repressor [Desulfovibrio sp. OttesenSCG-928-A18]
MSQTRMTKQRAVILEALRSVTSHPTADEIYGMVRLKLPRISLGTVYRNLELLASSGEILRLDRAGAQKRFDGNPAPHQHVRCRVCGRVGDVMSPVREPALSGVYAPGFTIDEITVEFAGICDSCALGGN